MYKFFSIRLFTFGLAITILIIDNCYDKYSEVSSVNLNILDLVILVNVILGN